MPRITGYDPEPDAPRIYGEDVFGHTVDDPDGMFSGMTLGLARDGEGFCQITNMPPDSRMSGTLPNKNQYDDDD